MMIAYICCLLLIWRVWLLVNMHYFSAMLVALVFLLQFCCLFKWNYPFSIDVKGKVIEDDGLESLCGFHKF